MENPKFFSNKGDYLGDALRRRDWAKLSGYIDATLPGINPEQRSIVMNYLGDAFPELNGIGQKLNREQLIQASQIFEAHNSRLMFVILRQLKWEPQNIEFLENIIGVGFPNHRSALFLYNLDQFLGRVQAIAIPNKPIDAMSRWYSEFRTKVPSPESVFMSATHQTLRTSADSIQNNGGFIHPSNSTIYAPFAGVNLGLAGSYKYWITDAPAVTFPIDVPLSDIFPTFSGYDPVPRALGIYPLNLSVDLTRDVSPARFSRFEVKFPSRANNSQLFARSLERMGLASCGDSRSGNNTGVKVETNQPYIIMASLAKIVGASDCRIIE